MKCLILIFLLFGYLFAEQQNVGVMPNNVDEELAKIFVSPDDTIVNNGQCTWSCRKVNKDYVTQISGFDFSTGTTYCSIYEKNNLDVALRYNANQRNLACVKQISDSIENDSQYSQLKSLIDNFGISVKSSIQHTPSENKITMSRFLSALVTLDPDIIDREKTESLGELVLKNGIEIPSTSGMVYDPKEAQKSPNELERYFKFQLEKRMIAEPVTDPNATYQKSSVLDGFNKNNMAYFSNLFMNMQEVYKHLQILLFIVVGGYFLGSIGANKLQIYLENRGEQTSNQPYLHKFYIPMLMVGFFFMPIPEANGKTDSTIVQNTIRFFTREATNIADMASAIGGNTYMNKLYNSIGGIDVDGIKLLIEERHKNRFIKVQGNNIYKGTCSLRFEKPSEYLNEKGYMRLTEEEKQDLKRIASLDRAKVAGTDKDISLEACLNTEQQINEALLAENKVNARLNGISEFYSNNNLQNEVSKMDKFFATRENQLGWINSIIVPTSIMLVETAKLITNDKMPITDMKTAREQDLVNTRRNLNDGKIDDENEEKVSDTTFGWLAGNLVWMSLPGASAIKDFVMENTSKVLGYLGGALGAVFGGIGSIFLSIAGSIVGKVSGTVAGYTAAIYLIQSSYAYIPIIVSAVAGLVAFVSYLVSLCKYFYVSPFVVAFSLATKRMDKIIEFLISGISIFFRPILIVMFIYLALFIHTLISELFIFISVEQFGGVYQQSFLVGMITGAMVGMLEIFALLSASYIMWKLIVSGPGWALGLVGIDGKHDDMIAQGLEQKMAQKAFVA